MTGRERTAADDSPTAAPITVVQYKRAVRRIESLLKQGIFHKRTFREKSRLKKRLATTKRTVGKFENDPEGLRVLKLTY